MLSNIQGQYHLDDILTDPKGNFITDFKNGDFKIYSQDGRGAYFRNDGSLRGFIEKKDMNKKFTIELCSDLGYEEMVADVSYENHTIAMITQKNGIDNMEIEIFLPEKETKSLRFSLNDFIESIVLAKKCLIEMQKLSDE